MIPRILLSIFLAITLLAGTVSLLGCTNKDVTVALGDAAIGAHSVARTAAAQFGAEDPRTKRIQKWADTLDKLKVDYAAATTPDDQLALLPTLNAALSVFQSDVLPLFNASPTVILVLSAIDVALRIAANHFVKTANKVAKSGLSRSMSGSLDDAAAEVEKLKDFLATPKVRKKVSQSQSQPPADRGTLTNAESLRILRLGIVLRPTFNPCVPVHFRGEGGGQWPMNCGGGQSQSQ